MPVTMQGLVMICLFILYIGQQTTWNNQLIKYLLPWLSDQKPYINN